MLNQIYIEFAEEKITKALDVKAEECTDRMWDVTHIPEELQNASTTGIIQSSSSFEMQC